MIAVQMVLLVMVAQGGHQHGAPASSAQATAPRPEGTPPPPVEVTLSPDEIRAVGLRTETAREEDFARTIKAVAIVSADERRIAHIHTRFSGYIEKLHANYIGQSVRKGQPLVEIFSPEVLAAQSEWVTALNQLDDARKRGAAEGELKTRMALANAARQRLALWDLPQSHLDAVQTSRKARRTVTLNSPLTGTITVKEAVQGLFVGPEVHLFEVADLSKVWVVADIYPYEVEDIKVGAPAQFLVDQGTDPQEGAVEFIAPTVNSATRTVTIRVTLSNADGKLKPGSYGSLSVEVPGRKGIAISDQAVLLTGDRAVVFVEVSPGRYRARNITLGRRMAGLVEVRRGLDPDEKVVVSAQFVLDAETQLRSTAGGHAGHGGH